MAPKPTLTGEEKALFRKTVNSVKRLSQTKITPPKPTISKKPLTDSVFDFSEMGGGR